MIIESPLQSNVSQYRNLENPFWMSYWLQSSPHGKHQTFIPPKIKYLQVVGIYELEGFPSLVSQGEAGGRSGSSWSRFLAQEASGGSWLRWSDRRDWFQKEVKRCTCWVLELTVLYIYIYIYIYVCLLSIVFYFCVLFSLICFMSTPYIPHLQHPRQHPPPCPQATEQIGQLKKESGECREALTKREQDPWEILGDCQFSWKSM